LVEARVFPVLVVVVLVLLPRIVGRVTHDDADGRFLLGVHALGVLGAEEFHLRLVVRLGQLESVD